MKKLAIYFAGTVQKDHEVMESRWTQEDFQILEKTLAPQKLALLNPSLRNDDLCDQKSVFGRDMSQVFMADIVFVDARHRRGLGVGAEMMWAKFHAKPVIVLAPNETHYRKATTEILGIKINEYVHPFVQNLSDKIVSSVEEGAEWIQLYLEGATGMIKDLTTIYEAMRHYQHTQYNHDHPMREIVESCNGLEKAFKEIPSILKRV